MKEIKQLEKGYRALLERGADLFETDIPAQLGPLLFGDEFKNLSASEYFHVK